MIDLTLYEKKVYSQYGEDGVLEEIFNLIGTTNKYFVEFGSQGTDEGMGNTAYLRRLGFTGLLMDCTSQVENPKYEVQIHSVNAENVEELFTKHHVPEEFDLLSIDIDGNDFYVWNAIKKYSPRVVVIEINGLFPEDVDWVHNYDPNFKWKGNWDTGASYKAMCILARLKGYNPVYLSYAGSQNFKNIGYAEKQPVNLISIRADIDMPYFTPIKYTGCVETVEALVKCKVGYNLMRGKHTSSTEILGL